MIHYGFIISRNSLCYGQVSHAMGRQGLRKQAVQLASQGRQTLWDHQSMIALVPKVRGESTPPWKNEDVPQIIEDLKVFEQCTQII